MAEQLIHKAALNGHLKFACELLKKKCDANSQSPSAPGSANSSNLSSTSKSLTPFSVNQQQDERLFKLASEILLSDEDSLRKLSAQLLNEAQHLNQLNCVLNTLKKIRWKYLKSIDASGEHTSRAEERNRSGEEVELNEDESNTDSSQTQLNYILAVIKDIFMQHKLQVNEQLSEVHKLMCISSDDDLLAHLQNQNNQLQQEVIKLREQGNNCWSDESKLSSAMSSMQQGTKPTGNNAIQLRKFGSLNKIELPKSNQNNCNTSNSSEKLVSNQQASHANSFQFNQSHHHHHHHHILSDLLSQDDTMC